MSYKRIPGLNHISSLLLVLALVAGCSTSTPTIDMSADTEATFDGLYPIKGGSADAAWARPGADLSHYTKIRLHSVGVEYRPGGETRRLSSARTSASHFEVTEAQRTRFEAVMREAFREELARSEHFTLVEEDGPDVLLIAGGLLDVVSHVPPEPVGRNNVYLSRVGEATLVLEIRDSITQATLVRAIDRRAAERSSGDFSHSNKATNRAEVRRLASFWARRLRTQLDEIAAGSQ